MFERWKHFLVVAVVGIAATTGLPADRAFAQQRGPLAWADLDRDGTITRQEFDEARVKRFERLDTDKDGVVTREEFMAVDAPAFARLDRNKDGKITPDEMPRRRGGR